MRESCAKAGPIYLLSTRFFAALCGVLSLALLPAQSPPPEAALARIQAHMRQSLERLPNHTCRLEIRRAHLGADVRARIQARLDARSDELDEQIVKKAEELSKQYRSNTQEQLEAVEAEYRALAEQASFDLDIPLDVTDSIALEAAFVGGKELYAFPDSPRFEDIPLAQLIGHGTVATGVFAGHTKKIIVDQVGSIVYSGEENVEGRRLQRFNYKVPLADSEYSVNNQGQATRVPYYGSFWATAESNELLRLTIRVDELPVDVGVVGFATQIDYQPLPGALEPLLVVDRSRFSMLLSTGVESVSETRFEDCRAFVGSSVLSFDDNSLRYYVERTEALNNFEVPLGTTLPVEITTLIDSDTSRVGDRIEAKLTRNIRLDDGSTIPKGAVLRGRLRRLEFYAGAQAYFGVGIEFQELLFDDFRAVVSLELDRIGNNTIGVQQQEPVTWIGNTVHQVNRGEVFTDMRNAGGAKPPDIAEQASDRFVSHALFGVGVFYVQQLRMNRMRLSPGLRMTWSTAANSPVQPPPARQ